jgi:hypothetical protein
MSRCSWPGHFLTTSRKGLLDTHLFFGKRSCSTKYCPASFSFLCHSSRTGSFYSPEELNRSHMFSGQSKNHHEITYTSGLRAFTHHQQHGYCPYQKRFTLIGTHPTANRLILHHRFRRSLRRARPLLGYFECFWASSLLLLEVFFHLSLIFSAGQGTCEMDYTEYTVMGLQET